MIRKGRVSCAGQAEQSASRLNGQRVISYPSHMAETRRALNRLFPNVQEQFHTVPSESTSPCHLWSTKDKGKATSFNSCGEDSFGTRCRWQGVVVGSGRRLDMLWCPLLGGDTNQIPSTISALPSNRSAGVEVRLPKMPKKNYTCNRGKCNEMDS